LQHPGWVENGVGWQQFPVNEMTMWPRALSPLLDVELTMLPGSGDANDP
jgi:hypothetical protein